MLYRLLLIVLIFCGMQPIHAQFSLQKPDYEKIQQVTSDPLSPMFYSRLFMRYISDDTTLTQQEFQSLYYGYFFQDGYRLYNTRGYKDSIQALSTKEALSIEERRKMISFAKRDLKFTPYDLTDLNWLCNLYYVFNDVENYKIYKYKVRMITKVIRATGDGKTANTAFHILSVGDEYNVLALQGLKYASHKTNAEKKYDYVTVEENTLGITGVYFDISQIFESYTRLGAGGE